MRKGSGVLLALAGAGILLLMMDKKKAPPGSPGSKGSITPADKQKFIDLILPYVKAVGSKLGIPYKFLLAQIILETKWGRSLLFINEFNVGGVKAVPGQAFKVYPTWEYIKGKKVRVYQPFAKYKNLQDGILGYSKIFQNKYFRKYLNKTKDPYQFASLLQSGRPKYATDINYIPKIHSLIDNLKA